MLETVYYLVDFLLNYSWIAKYPTNSGLKWQQCFYFISPFLWVRNQAQHGGSDLTSLMQVQLDSGWVLRCWRLEQLARHLFSFHDLRSLCDPSPCGLSLGANWGFLPACWPQESWNVHVMAGDFRSKNPMGQAEMVLLFLSWPQMSHSTPSSLFYWLQPSQEPSLMAECPGHIVGVHVT